MQRAPRTQRTLLTRFSHKSPLLHVETSSTRTSTGARAPLTSPTAPCVPLLSPHARQRSAWAPVSPESPTGCSHLFLAPSSAPSRLPTPRASSSPPARTPAGPHLSLQLMLGCSGHPAGLGSGRRGGKERSCWSLPAGMPGPGCAGLVATAASRRAGRFLLLSAGSHSSFSLQARADASCPCKGHGLPGSAPRWGTSARTALCVAPVTQAQQTIPAPACHHLNSALS